LAALIDIPPTAVDYAGLNQPENFHGDSLKRLIYDGNWDRDHVIAEDVDEGELTKLMYRDDRWKYITDFETTELYDISADFGESKNLADTRSGVCEDIKETIESHRALVADHAGERTQAAMDEMTRQRLRDLGYME
jgi:arylsulfatase A-like enzyme